MSPAFSPDGRWLAYTSNETGQDEIYVVPFPNTSAGKWAISAGGGTEPLWAHHGGEVFFLGVSRDPGALGIKTHPPILLRRATGIFFAPRFTSLPFLAPY